MLLSCGFPPASLAGGNGGWKTAEALRTRAAVWSEPRISGGNERDSAILTNSVFVYLEHVFFSKRHPKNVTYCEHKNVF